MWETYVGGRGTAGGVGGGGAWLGRAHPEPPPPLQGGWPHRAHAAQLTWGAQRLGGVGGAGQPPPLPSPSPPGRGCAPCGGGGAVPPPGRGFCNAVGVVMYGADRSPGPLQWQRRAGPRPTAPASSEGPRACRSRRAGAAPPRAAGAARGRNHAWGAPARPPWRGLPGALERRPGH